jgi:hypothetical protein
LDSELARFANRKGRKASWQTKATLKITG